MAEAEPTIRYTDRAGKPVVEVGGTWTVFSVRGIRKKAEKALQAAGAGTKGQRVIDATGLERVDTAGALEILELAGDEAKVETKNDEQAALFKIVRENMCDAHPPHHVNGLVHWLEEIGRGSV